MEWLLGKTSVKEVTIPDVTCRNFSVEAYVNIDINIASDVTKTGVVFAISQIRTH
ncbi:MAG: hypothetical protein ACYS6K_28520 [Planctomycetota bacterium]|jgi:hypothetical protein